MTSYFILETWLIRVNKKVLHVLVIGLIVCCISLIKIINLISILSLLFITILVVYSWSMLKTVRIVILPKLVLCNEILVVLILRVEFNLISNKFNKFFLTHLANLLNDSLLTIYRLCSACCIKALLVLRMSLADWRPLVKVQVFIESRIHFKSCIFTNVACVLKIIHWQESLETVYILLNGVWIVVFKLVTCTLSSCNLASGHILTAHLRKSI